MVSVRATDDLQMDRLDDDNQECSHCSCVLDDRIRTYSVSN